MAHSHILNHCEWSLARLNGVVRAKLRGRTDEEDVQSAMDYARKCGATPEQIRTALESPTRLRFEPHECAHKQQRRPVDAAGAVDA